MPSNGVNCLQLLLKNSSLPECDSASLKAVFITGIVGIVLLTVSVLLLFSSLCCVVWKARQIKRYFHDHIEEQKKSNHPSSESMRNACGFPADMVSQASICNEKDMQAKLKEDDQGELEMLKFMGSSYKNSPVEHKHSTDIVYSHLSRPNPSAPADGINASASVSQEESFNDIKEYEEIEMNSMTLCKSQDDIKSDEMVQNETDVSFYSEVKEMSVKHESNTKEVINGVEDRVKTKGESSTADAKKDPVYSVVDLKSKRKRKLLGKDKESQHTADSSPKDASVVEDIAKQPPLYSVVNVKSKKKRRNLDEKEKLEGAGNLEKNLDITLEDEAQTAPLYSVVNLEMKKNCKKAKKIEKEDGEERHTSLSPDEDIDTTPAYAVVNLKNKKARKALNGEKTEDSDIADASDED